MYTLEVFSSIVWGGPIRCREAHSRVQYPTEIDDEFFSDGGFDMDGATAFIASNPRLPRDPHGRHVSWLRGWNLTTDLYRILEYATDRFRTRRLEGRRNIISVIGLFGEKVPPAISVMDNVGAMVNNLPQVFKVFQPVTRDIFVDRYSFQAANIVVTVQLVRMLLFESTDGEVAQKCAVATELLDSFLRIPIDYLRAISAPLLHHLAGIGTLLGSVIERPISDHAYTQVRQILLDMARLLSLLEDGLQQAADARGTPSASLKSHIERIDNYMAHHRNTQYNTQAQETNQPKPDDLNQQNLADASHGFQIPDELLQDWPWPVSATQNHENDLLPLQFNFNWDYNAE